MNLMFRHTAPQALVLGILFSLTATVHADDIYMTDGKILRDVDVQTESLSVVTYKEGKSKEEVASEDVLRVVYERKPKTVEEAEGDAGEENFVDAVAALEDYISGVLGKAQKRFPWAPAYAMYRTIEINALMGKWNAVNSAADRLIEHAAESRYLPLAYMAKAKALADSGKVSAALGVMKEFGKVIGEKSLSKRWQLEKDLTEVLLNEDLTGDARRQALSGVVKSAGRYSVVKSRANVAIGESFLLGKKVKEAKAIFLGITEDPKADNTTLAAAHTGLGDCLFHEASKSKSEAAYRKALMEFMMVAVVYKTEMRYVPKAMFYAARCFDFLEGEVSKAHAQKLYVRLIVNFKGDTWATEARTFLKRK